MPVLAKTSHLAKSIFGTNETVTKVGRVSHELL